MNNYAIIGLVEDNEMEIQLEVTAENLLNAVVQMPEHEFNRFIEKAKEIRIKRKPLAENDLIHKINTIYSAEKRQRYNRLYEKFKEEIITPKEHKELMKLSDEFEILNAKRLEYLGELAKLRGQPFEKIVKEFKIKF